MIILWAIGGYLAVLIVISMVKSRNLAPKPFDEAKWRPFWAPVDAD